ncbi:MULTISPECIES: Mbeg1-like protein [unclassified Acinetobacter]|uniref:Mbeg1-like protein n=1 Tax=unclassified Acinetobacter TaxID=196816 RepID=UPI001F4B6F68|nr:MULTISPECIES: Mbeg1-like protein [unclassified Acinetobacter]MCH7350354.1 DUF2974 domain-containing protein [Acinetobacter sp. NIPH 2023]MCH7358006.1 DUF2974 domain-containing protein [Acinetobacter sp. NIPH 2024]
MGFSAKTINAEIAARNALYAMMASNCYHEKDKLYFPIEKWNWLLVDKDGDPTDQPTKEGFLTGFAYDIYEHQNSNKTVMAFRGTDSKKDWIVSNLAVPFSIPYKSARKAVRKYLEKFPERNLSLVGHSLGGGLALGASCYYGIPAYVFNPSPRVFDGLGDYHENATRICFYQRGDTLDQIRDLWSEKFLSVVKAEDIYESDFEYGAQHDSDLLAESFRILGARQESRLLELAGVNK